MKLQELFENANLIGKWIAMATVDGKDHNGEVLGYIVCNDEAYAKRFTDRRGEWADWLHLRDIPDDLNIEIISYDDFKKEYGDRMPLKNQLKA
jgi:hypothetical protein